MIEEIKTAILKAQIPMSIDQWKLIYHDHQEDVRMAVWELVEEDKIGFDVKWNIIPRPVGR